MSPIKEQQQMEKARFVFGEAVMMEEDVDIESCDMCYSSPSQDGQEESSQASSTRSQSCESRRSLSQNGDVDTTLTQPSVKSRRSTTTFKDSFVSKERSSNVIVGKSNPNGPFDKILISNAAPVDITTGKENKPQLFHNHNNNNKQRQQQSHRLQNLKQRSPLGRDLVKKTQDAINRASASVNRPLQAARVARQANMFSKSQLTAKVRQEWQQEREIAAAFHQQAKQDRLQMLQAKRNLSTQYSQARAQEQQDSRLKMLQIIEKESQFMSSVYREQQEELRQLRDQRRRMSTEAKAKMRQNRRQGEERLRLARIEEDSAILEDRHAASVAVRETKQQQAKERRQSFAFRNGDARRIRQLHAKLEQESLAKQHESYQLKWAAEKDAEAAKCRMEEIRRQSLASRGQVHHQQRLDEQARLAQIKTTEHQSFELKWEAERDAEEFRQKIEQQRRESLAFRNSQAARQRKEESERRQQELAAEHASFELKLAGERDADEYRNRLEQQRRDSLAGRNQELRRQIKEAKLRRNVEIMEEHESYELKWAGEKDAEKYKKQLEQERRESFAYRNKEGARQRKVQSEKQTQEIVAQHASFELKWAGERDVEAYQKELERQRRESLAKRNNEKLHHAKVMKELEALAREKETESLVLKWAGEEDAKVYLAKLENDRRISLQLRGQQVRHHREVEATQREEQLRRAAEDERFRSSDHRDVESYNKSCAARERTSLQYRGKECHMKRLEETERRLQQQRMDDAHFELETLARTDVEDYIRSCKERRRLSLAFRAAEKRRHAEWCRRQAEMERETLSRDVRDRLIDRRYEELARHQERARMAMDAIRHAGCSFNPFQGGGGRVF